MRGIFSPGSSGQSKSRKERLEAAKEQNERSRRKSFAFMKYSPDRRSTTSLARTRAHARELAMALSNEEVNDPESTQGGSAVPETPMSQQHLQLTPKSSSFQTAGILDNADDFDPFNHNGGGGGGGGFQPAPVVTKQVQGGNSLLDQHLSSQEPTASTATMSSMQDSFETGSVGSAYDMDAFLSGAAFPSPTGNNIMKRNNSTRKKKNGTSLDQFVERHQSPMYANTEMQSVMSGPRGGGWPSAERSVISMPTFPSNSTMQGAFSRQSSVVSSSSGASSGGSGGAAARRRMRNQMRHHSGNSSVCSDTSSIASGTPPESPSSSVRRSAVESTTPGSAGHQRRGSNSSHNRLLQYQAPALPLSAGGGGGRPKMSSGSSFYSQASSANNSFSSDANNLFSAEEGGFTFDAFGLDAGEVEREVNEAMQELAGQVPGFSVFFEDQQTPFPSQQQHAASPSHSVMSNSSPRILKQQQQHLQQPDEFAPQNWDSPQGSRTTTPVPMDSEDDGFVDGFRVTRTSAEQQSSEQVPSGFGTPTGGSAALRRRLGRSSSNLSSSTPAPQSQIKPVNVQTPPRWENSSAGRNSGTRQPYNNYQRQQPRGGFNDPYNVSPDMADLFDTPVNPFQEDPWNSGPGSDDDPFQSDDNGNNSDVGTDSDFGTKSDIGGVGRFNSSNLWTSEKKNSRILSDSKSDVGAGSTNAKSVSFHADVRLPQQPQQHQQQQYQHDSSGNWTDDEDEGEIDDMNDAIAQEFATEFSNRLHSPAAAQQAAITNSFSHARRLDFGANAIEAAPPSTPHSDHGAAESDFTQSDYGAPSDVGSGFGTADSDFFGQSDQGVGDGFGSESNFGPSTRSDYNDNFAADHGQPQSADHSSQPADYGPPKSPRGGPVIDYGPSKSPRGGPVADYGPSKSPRGGAHQPMDYGPGQSPRGLQGSEYGPSKSPRGLQHQETYGSSNSPRVPKLGDYGPSKSPRGGHQRGDYGPESSHLEASQPRDYGPAKSPRVAQLSPSNHSAQQQFQGHSKYGMTSGYVEQQTHSGPSDHPQSDDGGTSDYGSNVHRNGPQESKSPRRATSQPTWLPNTGVARYGRQSAPSPSEYGQEYGSSYGASSQVGANSDYGLSSDGGAGSRYIGSEDGVNSDVQGRQSDVSSGAPLVEVTSKERPLGRSPRGYDPSSSRSEEKKDDEEPKKPSFSLKDKWRQWESKQANTSVVESSPGPKELSRGPASGASLTQKSLGGELLTPDIVESRRQAARKMRAEDLRKSTVETSVLSPDALRRPTNSVSAKDERLSECNEQRNSFASFRERLKPSPQSREEATAKSESGAAFRTSSVANKVLNALSPRNGESLDVNKASSSYRETQSDTGSTPAFLSNVKLRKTSSVAKRVGDDLQQNYSTDAEPENDYGSPESHNQRPMSYRERRALEEQNTKGQEYGQSPDDLAYEEPEAPKPEKTLTYRERRELELRKEQEEKAKKEKPVAAPKRDVASLIRRRIAANKAKEEEAKSKDQGEEGPGDVSQYRGMLKPTKISNDSQQDIGAASSYDTESGSLYSRGSVSPRRFPRTSPGNNAAQDINGNARAHPPSQFQEQPTSIQPQENEKSTSGYSDHYQVVSGGQAIEKMVSPTSAGSEMVYSPDNSTLDGVNYGASQPVPELRGPRALADDLEEEKPVPRVLEKLRMEGSFPLSPETLSPENETPETTATSQTSEGHKSKDFEESATNPDDVKSMLVNFLGGKSSNTAAEADVTTEDAANTLMRSREPRPVKGESPISEEATESNSEKQSETAPSSSNSDGRPALKDDPKYERYFRMLKVGMPMDVVKHAMSRDGNDPSVMDGDHNKPVGLALKDDPKYAKYFKMLKFGISMDQVKHAMERDGLMPDVMDLDHNLPAQSCEMRSRDEPKEKPTHRRARLHWKTLQKVRSNSLWAKLEEDQMLNDIDIDEQEFNELFKADLTPAISPRGLGSNRKRGAAVRVIDAKRANNGGIILARLKMTHDDMADAVDRIDGSELSPEQIENIIEFLPTKDERKLLEAYMLEGGQDAAEKFDGLCECEKFMVSMMTVKHAKRKVRALLFKLQFMGCLQAISAETTSVETACDELSNSTRLRHLLGIVLEFGNRLNTAGVNSKRKAGAFSLESLLKLNQAKAFDKKTTFLHYIVLIVRRNNELLLRFEDDLPTVLKSDKVYWDQCLADLEEVENQLENVRRISLYQARMQQEYKLKRRNRQDDENDSLGDVSLSLEEEVESLRATNIGLFTLGAIKKVSALRDKVELTKEKFNRLLEYFGEDEKKLQPHELFNYISVFCREFSKAKEEVFANIQKKQREDRKKARQSTPNIKSGKPPAAPDRSSQKPLRASSFQPNMSKVIKDFQRADSDPTPTHGSKSPRSNMHKQVERNLHSPPNKAEPQSKSPDTRNFQKPAIHEPARNNFEVASAPLPPGLQEAGRLDVPDTSRSENQPITDRIQPYQPSSTASSAPYSSSTKNAMRHKARIRRQRQMQVTSGRATPVASNATNVGTSATPPTTGRTVLASAPTAHINTPPPPAPTESFDDAPITRGSSPRSMMRHRRRHVEALKRSSPTSQIPRNTGVDWPVQPNVAAS